MRKKYKLSNSKLDDRAINRLFSAANEAQNKKQTELFIKSILTQSEKLMLGRRLLIAELLLTARTQAEIVHEYKLSPNTVWRIKKWLLAEFPDYEKVIKESRKKVESNVVKVKEYDYDPLSFAALKKKYPAHFLLFNIAEHLLK